MSELPDAIAKLVEEKVREALDARDQAEQRKLLVQLLGARARRLEHDAHVAEGNRRRLALASTARKTELADARSALNDLVRHPPRAIALSRPLAILVLVLAVVVGGVLFPSCVEPTIGHSVLAASLLCPHVCASCRGPGRVFEWHESSRGAVSYEGNVSTQLCHNAHVDVDRLTWMDVSNREEKDLAPYRLTLWSSVPADALLVGAALLLLAPLAAARGRRRRLTMDRKRLEARVRDLEAQTRADAAGR